MAPLYDTTPATKAWRERAASLRERARSVTDPALRDQWLRAAIEWEWLAYEAERTAQAEAAAATF